MTITEQQDAIQRLLDSGRSFALYRLPRAKHVELVLEDEEQPTNMNEPSTDGFIFAPFNETSKCPTVHIRPERTACGWEEIVTLSQELNGSKPISLTTLDNVHAHPERATESEDYKDAFQRLYKEIEEGRFEKLVLSYSQANTMDHLLGHEAEVFVRALNAYPDAMVCLVYAPQCGRWIGSTPELLLKRNGDEWQTVALAGTTEDSEAEWDTKNIHEQDVVVQYITQTLKNLGAKVELQPCETVHIGKLAHRRTQFNFSFRAREDGNDTTNVPDPMQVIRALHPTPAVCGLPKDEAKSYLLRCELSDRNYFSGYLGRIHANGDAQVFVNLRCAQITDNVTYYHAGGGLTAASKFEDEAREIELKMETLKTLLRQN